MKTPKNNVTISGNTTNDALRSNTKLAETKATKKFDDDEDDDFNDIDDLGFEELGTFDDDDDY
ncbi:hypothetical protein [Desertivirga arenae]|uniref:hypothetical protein n=1 Tax=Desertivirga arenae TaxID=2810309 RepID=UPI001A97CCCC|nr:hypothetical protein [Pedobacter sp. SYSU D00823]